MGPSRVPAGRGVYVTIRSQLTGQCTFITPVMSIEQRVRVVKYATCPASERASKQASVPPFTFTSQSVRPYTRALECAQSDLNVARPVGRSVGRSGMDKATV